MIVHRYRRIRLLLWLENLKLSALVRARLAERRIAVRLDDL
jgi:hypothetical protein